MWSNLRTKKALFCALGIVACASLIMTQRPALPPVNKALYLQVGRTLAAEGLKLLKPGGKFTIIVRDTLEYPQPAMTLSLASLEREIRRSGAEVRSIESIQLDPIRPVEVAPGDFYEVLRRSAPGDVVVSLLGPPLLSDEQRIKLGRPKAQIVALCPTAANAEQLLRTGWLQVAIVNKAPAEGKSFEGLYSVMRAQASPVSTASL
jgi:hypothetical protein